MFLTMDPMYIIECSVPLENVSIRFAIEEYSHNFLEKIIDEKESFNSQQIELERAARQHDPIYKTKENGLKKLFHSLRKRERE